MVRRRLSIHLLASCTLLGGCAAGSVAGTAVDVAAASDKEVKGVKGNKADKPDNSGITIRFREPTEADRAKRRMAEQQAEEEDRRAAQQRKSPR